MEVGRVARDAALTNLVTGGSGSHIVGFGDETSPAAAAVANGTLAHALDFDDTHNETMIHVSAPIVTTVLTLGEALGVTGREAVVAVCAGREATCRMALPAPGAFHGRGFHATSVFGTLGAAAIGARLLGLDVRQVVNAVGIAGSQASGLLEFFSDGSWVKRMHPGWAAHAGIWAASLARTGFTGPASILEGRFGLFNSHLGNGDYAYERITEDLGSDWTSLRTSFKPYPCGHVIHQFIDALKLVMQDEALHPDNVSRITCRIAQWMVPIVCEPVEVKRRPATEYHAKFSLQYSVAAALVLGELGVEAYSAHNIADRRILDLADRVAYEIDETAPDTRQFKGWIIVETRDGQRLEEIVDTNWGSLEKPMTPEDVRQKFHRNATLALEAPHAERIQDLVEGLEDLDDVGELVRLCSADNMDGAAG
jgi:2-methylcitrate dehydratase PrpD